jgi:PAS domain S-box-containing protein
MLDTNLTALLHNTALLLSMVLVYDLATSRHRIGGRPLRQALVGVVLGFIGIGIMLVPLRFEPGIVFDTRSVLLAASGLLLGAVPTAVAMAMTAAFRLYQGGAAAWTGVAVILASGGIGIAWRHSRRKPLGDVFWYELYGLGVVVHVVMLALMLTLPWETGWRVLSGIGLPVLLIYPPATAALGVLLANRLRRERAASVLEESEGRYRSLFESITERKRAEEEPRRLLAAAEQSRRTLLSVVEDQRRAEEALRLRTTALEAAANAMVITDRGGRIEWVNPAFSVLTGYAIEESLGRNPRDLVRSGRHDETFYKNLWDTILAGRVWRGELVNRRKDGGRYTEEQTITPVLNGEGQISHFIAVKQDVTSRKHAEEERQTLDGQLRQAQKMESVGRLAGGIAHDFNNALGVILGHAEQAMQGLEPSERLHHHLEVMRDAALRSAKLTRQLLAFARKQTIAPRALDLNDAVAGMLNMLRRLIGEDIHLAWMPGAALWPVKMDPAQIDQILANLLVNARDAIGGVGKVTVETRNVVIDGALGSGLAGCVPGEYVMLAVGDDGCGMEQDVLDQLFEPFFTTKPVGQGTGLGLATVYGIVTQNAGSIDVSSEPGKGTTFRIYLPRVAGKIPDARADRVAEEPRGRGETVLLVEDEPAMLEIGAEILAQLGYSVLTADRPSQALSVAQAHAGEIQLLITDVVMPEMNGRELAEGLAASRPAIRSLFVSGYTSDIIAHRGVLEEGIHFLEKPFSRRDLAVKVRQALDD